jgi:hypothetical protein
MAFDALETAPLVATPFPSRIVGGFMAREANRVGVLCSHVLDAGTRWIFTCHLTFHMLLGSGVTGVALVFQSTMVCPVDEVERLFVTSAAVLGPGLFFLQRGTNDRAYRAQQRKSSTVLGLLTRWARASRGR